MAPTRKQRQRPHVRQGGKRIRLAKRYETTDAPEYASCEIEEEEILHRKRKQRQQPDSNRQKKVTAQK
jgi:hypothetical protein